MTRVSGTVRSAEEFGVLINSSNAAEVTGVQKCSWFPWKSSCGENFSN